MQIEIICTGDEVLTGKIVNSNFSYISQKLEDFGLSVRWGTTVGDDREMLLRAKEVAESRGFRMLHALVDSMWLQRPGATRADYEGLAQAVDSNSVAPSWREA